MTKIDIYSGFLGAGKTTLIKKMISEGYKGEKKPCLSLQDCWYSGVSTNCRDIIY